METPRAGEDAAEIAASPANMGNLSVVFYPVVSWYRQHFRTVTLQGQETSERRGVMVCGTKMDQAESKVFMHIFIFTTYTVIIFKNFQIVPQILKSSKTQDWCHWYQEWRRPPSDSNS